MSDSDALSPERVADLVLENRVIRAPYYEKSTDEGMEFTDPARGLQWGADAVPALLGLFRVEADPRTDQPDGWIGFARHWRGGTLRLDFDLFTEHDEAEPILVVTALHGRAGEDTIEDPEFGEIDLSDEVPSKEEWTERDKQYQAVRRTGDSGGSAAVHAFFTALPGWKQEVAMRLDDVVESEVPEVRRAVKWHQPFYGVEDEGWFASFSAFTNHVKLTFVADSFLEPRPPKGNDPSRQAIDIEESDSLDEDQFASWVRQAAEGPGMNW